MIVNSAYMYMGKKEPETHKNELWTNGKLNYQFTILNGNASFDSANNRLLIAGGSSINFTGLDFSNYNNITIKYRKPSGLSYTSCRFKFVLPDGSTYGGGTTVVYGETESATFSITNKTATAINLRPSTYNIYVDSVIWN